MRRRGAGRTGKTLRGRPSAAVQRGFPPEGMARVAEGVLGGVKQGGGLPGLKKPEAEISSASGGSSERFVPYGLILRASR
ncbi:MAG: hypothetical protein BWY88_01253 [Synergistetes bacterium ADurb.Bin520]|nr:MAG: hypothetical protein BWY88_01253 [Synergistetes bacterium ADurb.Bin520]